MDEGLFQRAVNWLLGPEPITEKRPGHLWPRWIFLRALGLIYFSAFYSLLFQIKGLIGPNGILPAADYLQAVNAALHLQSYWTVPTLLWFGASNGALMTLCWVGLAASLLVTLNLWPRAGLLICFLCFVSFVSVARDFSGLSVGRHVAGSGIHRAIFRAAGLAARVGRAESAFAREPFSAAVGMVPDLFRIRRRENRKRRSGVAAIHRDGRLLPERAAADMDRMVRAAFAALVSRSGDGLHASGGTAGRVDAVSAEAISHRMLFYRDAV